MGIESTDYARLDSVADYLRKEISFPQLDDFNKVFPRGQSFLDSIVQEEENDPFNNPWSRIIKKIGYLIEISCEEIDKKPEISPEVYQALFEYWEISGMKYKSLTNYLKKGTRAHPENIGLKYNTGMASFHAVMDIMERIDRHELRDDMEYHLKTSRSYLTIAEKKIPGHYEKIPLIRKQLDLIEEIYNEELQYIEE